jgi:hypothetical protein
MTLTVEAVKKVVSYDPESGVFTRLTATGGKSAGSVAGGRDLDGYTTISVFGKRYRAARLAWLLMTGEWPVGDVDHINRTRCDDRWSNLRVATRSQNSANSGARSGKKGACWVDAKKKWKAQIRVGGKSTHIGYFSTEDDAHAAYKTAAVSEFGEFAAW